jgi:hypothetical protein
MGDIDTDIDMNDTMAWHEKESIILDSLYLSTILFEYRTLSVVR